MASRLSFVREDIFDSPAQTIVNAVNTVGVMGRGIALSFKKRYPDMFRQYKAHCETGALTIGKLWLYRTPDKWILNFPTKKHWRQPSKPEYIRAGLEKLVRTYTAQGITSIAFPQLGTGNGRLDWKTVVRPMMQDYLGDLAVPVYIHIARRRRGFVAEHEDRAVLEGAMLPREDISFRRFLSDLRMATGEPKPPETLHRVGEDEEPLELPAVVLPADGGTASELPGEDIEELWQMLRVRGAVPMADFPGETRRHASRLVSALVKLDYIQPFKFALGPGRPPGGVRFAPASTREPNTHDVDLSVES
jgi:O-acetyl-ADP-ribose deacetylase (regulator of RNase III)